jgi:hypothetical protein
LSAAEGALWAAWACDEVGDEDAGDFFRREALRCLDGATAEHIVHSSDRRAAERSWDRGSRAVTIIDLERRLGEFQDAVTHVIELETWAEHREHRDAAAFELQLIRRHDQRRYSYRDAERYAASVTTGRA